MQEILAQTNALEERVEKLADGPVKIKLRDALAEIRANIAESAVDHDEK
jgi:hypothetical protein